MKESPWSRVIPPRAVMHRPADARSEDGVSATGAGRRASVALTSLPASLAPNAGKWTVLWHCDGRIRGITTPRCVSLGPEE
jgi:hypothetical protein